MLTATSKYSSAKGNSCASAWIGMILFSSPIRRKRVKLSVALIQRSVANTVTPYSFAKNIEVKPFPQPRSSTRIPSWSVSEFVSSSRILEWCQTRLKRCMHQRGGTQGRVPPATGQGRPICRAPRLFQENRLSPSLAHEHHEVSVVSATFPYWKNVLLVFPSSKSLLTTSCDF